MIVLFLGATMAGFHYLIFSNSEDKQRVEVGALEVFTNDLIYNANNMYEIGMYAKKTLNVKIPDSINKIYIENEHTLVFSREENEHEYVVHSIYSKNPLRIFGFDNRTEFSEVVVLEKLQNTNYVSLCANTCEKYKCDGKMMDKFCKDDDGDGFGNPAEYKNACIKPTGYVKNCDDCDDSFFNARYSFPVHLDVFASNGCDLVCDCPGPTGIFAACCTHGVWNGYTWDTEILNVPVAGTYMIDVNITRNVGGHDMHEDFNLTINGNSISNFDQEIINGTEWLPRIGELQFNAGINNVRMNHIYDILTESGYGVCAFHPNVVLPPPSYSVQFCTRCNSIHIHTINLTQTCP